MIDLETVMDAGDAMRAYQLALQNRQREASSLVLSARKNMSYGLRQFIQLGFDARTPVIGIHPWDLPNPFGGKGPSSAVAEAASEKPVAAQQYTPFQSITLQADAGPEGIPGQAAAVLKLTLPFDVSEFETAARLKKQDPARFKEFLLNCAGDDANARAIIDAFLP